MIDAQQNAALADVFRRHPGVRLGVVFGSRARGDATERSDWDIGYLATDRLDRDGLLVDLVRALNTERIDLVDLDRANGLVRFRAARDGVVIVERTADAFERFWLDAVHFWCDMGPIIRAAYEDVLAELSR